VEGNPNRAEGNPSQTEGNPSRTEGKPSSAEGNPNLFFARKFKLINELSNLQGAALQASPS
jgi:hypothetical protein